MNRLAACLLLLATALRAAEKPAAPAAITAQEIPSPAGANASGVSVTTGPDGTAWLSWIEPTPKWDPLESTCRHASLSIL